MEALPRCSRIYHGNSAALSSKLLQELGVAMLVIVSRQQDKRIESLLILLYHKRKEKIQQVLRIKISYSFIRGEFANNGYYLESTKKERHD